ncbi:MAG: carbohydrate ABC transporter substrate-binding protein [Spirochaetes bacterium]|nr:carbohydrate ABC transporter substrate-binding protein [Spirochaetota bacterium]
MKNLFIILLATLIAFTQFVNSRPTGPAPTGKPVLVWATGINPARQEQVEGFYRWLAKNHYPPMEIRMDNVGLGMQKFIVQGTSGVAADLVDIFSQQISSVFYLREMGILAGVDDLEKRFGTPDRGVWEPLRTLLYQDGKQIAFPGNHAPEGILLNVEAFRKVGMPLPPFRWSFDAFERTGIEYTRRARAQSGKSHFFIYAIPWDVFRRSAGIPLFNETMTRPAMNTPRYVAHLKRMEHWGRGLGLAPSAAECQSFNTGSGAMQGNWQWQVFSRGYFATLTGNSAALIQLRLFGHRGDLSAILPPDDGFPNVIAKTRTIGLYAGSKNKELAKYFLAYLRSEEYSMLVIRQTDAIPPDIQYLATEEYLRPVGHTNEWPLHQGFRTMVEKYAAPVEYTPFALMPNIDRQAARALDEFASQLLTPEEVAARMEAAFALEIEQFLAKRPALRARYQAALEKQARIDALKAAGKAVPLELIDNPFNRTMAARR